MNQEYEALFAETARRAVQYRNHIGNRAVMPEAEALQQLERLNEPFPEHAIPSLDVLRMLDEIGSPATAASTAGRFFGFVVGSSLPAAVAANWLATAWDQEGGQVITAPIIAALEEICSRWLVELFSLPDTTGVGFTTGATTANFTGLAAARHAVLAREGWDVERAGLFGAPPINVIVGDDVHASMLKALGLVGFGRERVIRVPVDAQGRMKAELLPKPDGLTIICAQVGHVATGACDPMEDICRHAKEINAWVHVDGAFGLWAAASPRYAALVRGIEQADSWVTDGHKWLNVPYDSGLVFVRDAANLRAAMGVTAAYLTLSEQRQPDEYVPEMSRRGRGVEIWAALKSLGREGLQDLIERTCGYAAFFADGLRHAGYEVLNEVVLNQVLVSFGSDAQTDAVIAAVQADGTCWCGGTTYHGRRAMRISVSSWATTQADCDLSLAAILRIAGQQGAG